MSRREEIVFNGVTFRRYPDSENRTHRVYFRPKTADAARGVQALHQEIWKAAYGPIPHGCHIHHKDGNPLNNDLGNLECLTVAEHRKAHRGESSERQREHLAAIRPAAAEWHASEEGRRWHSENSRKYWENPTLKPCVCQVCGTRFESPMSDTRFCSDRCREQNRGARTQHELTCACCGQKFLSVKKKARYCSRQCSGKARIGTKYNMRKGKRDD